MNAVARLCLTEMSSLNNCLIVSHFFSVDLSFFRHSSAFSAIAERVGLESVEIDASTGVPALVEADVIACFSCLSLRMLSFIVLGSRRELDATELLF